MFNLLKRIKLFVVVCASCFVIVMTSIYFAFVLRHSALPVFQMALEVSEFMIRAVWNNPSVLLWLPIVIFIWWCAKTDDDDEPPEKPRRGRKIETHMQAQSKLRRGRRT